VETIPRERRIEIARAQLLELHMECIALARKLESSVPASAERLTIAHQWEDAMNESFALQSHLENLMTTTHLTVH
jgi:hypothetical protein